LHRFPQLCVLAVSNETNEYIGVVVGKMDTTTDEGSDCSNTSNKDDDDDQERHLRSINVDDVDVETTGYIGMLAVTEAYRRKGIGQALVKRILRRMKQMGCCSATLETEVTNKTAQKLYQERFGFIREELLVRYYLNWNDAYRLRLWF
jgi:N-alpha-acetyltransferase 30